jgi:hypothetical protein
VSSATSPRTVKSAFRQRCTSRHGVFPWPSSAYSRATLDDLAGLLDRLSSKVLNLKRVCRIGVQSLGPLLDALCIKLVPVPDDEALAHNCSRLVKRNASQGAIAARKHKKKMPRSVDRDHRRSRLKQARADQNPAPARGLGVGLPSRGGQSEVTGFDATGVE